MKIQEREGPLEGEGDLGSEQKMQWNPGPFFPRNSREPDAEAAHVPGLGGGPGLLWVTLGSRGVRRASSGHRS